MADDVEYRVEKEYNITSAYGCYDSLTGTDPESLYGTDVVAAGIGCRG